MDCSSQHENRQDLERKGLAGGDALGRPASDRQIPPPGGSPDLRSSRPLQQTDHRPGTSGGQLGHHDGQVFRRREKPADPRRQGERRRRGGGEEDRRPRDQGPRPGGTARRADDGRVEGGPGPDRTHRDARIEGQARLRDDPDSPGTVRQAGRDHLHRPGGRDEDGRRRCGRVGSAGYPGPVRRPGRSRGGHGFEGGQGDRRGRYRRAARAGLRRGSAPRGGKGPRAGDHGGPQDGEPARIRNPGGADAVQ